MAKEAKVYNKTEQIWIDHELNEGKQSVTLVTLVTLFMEFLCFYLFFRFK